MEGIDRRQVLGAGLALASIPLAGNARRPESIGNGALYAVGVVSPDGAQTLAHYQRVLGIRSGWLADLLPHRAPPSSPSGPASAAAGRPPVVAEPDGTPVVFKMGAALMNNFYVKVFEPVSPNGPYAAHLHEYGMGIQDCQIQALGDMRKLRRELRAAGARLVLGTEADPWVYADFRKQLGTTIEAINQINRFPWQAAPDVTGVPLGAMPLSHVGFAVTDVRAAARAWSRILHRPLARITERRAGPFPAGSRHDDKARLRVAAWRQGEVGIELVQSVGGATPWSEFAHRQKGNAAYSLTFAVGDRFAEFARDLEARGGRRVHGEPGGDEALFDFTDVLGVAIGITARSIGG